MYQTPTVQSATALPQVRASEQTRACLSRYTADLLELLETNYSISPACFSHPPTAAQLLRGEWGQLLEELEGGHSYPRGKLGQLRELRRAGSHLVNLRGWPALCS